VKRRTFAIHAGPLGRTVLVEAIRCFAQAAYPPGGSDCAQVARETLLNTAGGIAASENGPAQASTRQRVLLRQAVQWYGDNLVDLDAEQRMKLTAALLQLLQGEAVDDGLFAFPGQNSNA